MSSILNFKKWRVQGEPVAILNPQIQVDAVILRYGVMACIDNGEEPTRTTVSKAVRDRAQRMGQDGLYYWADYFGAKPVDEDEIDAQVRALFPEAFK